MQQKFILKNENAIFNINQIKYNLKAVRKNIKVVNKNGFILQSHDLFSKT